MHAYGYMHAVGLRTCFSCFDAQHACDRITRLSGLSFTRARARALSLSRLSALTLSLSLGSLLLTQLFPVAANHITAGRTSNADSGRDSEGEDQERDVQGGMMLTMNSVTHR
jgi:hypothetical protein